MKPSVAERLFAGVLLVIAFGIVLHTPLTVWISTIYPDFNLILKSWKELLMGVATVLFLAIVYRREMFAQFLNDRLIQIILAYAGFHVLLFILFQNNPTAENAGLLIDLRYVLYFTLVYGAAKLLPGFRRLFLYAIFSGAVVVLGFALLQMFVLPRDTLTSLGYGAETIAPYLTVDDNENYVRINSTLRGPNPLGAYAIIIVTLIIAAAIKFGRKLKNDHHWVMGLAVASAGLMLAVSYSRSALGGFLIAIAIIIAVLAQPKQRKRLFMALGIGLVLITSLLLIARTDPVISHILWHDDPNGGGRVDSNSEHVSSLAHGAMRMFEQPVGGGIGSTGSASLLTDEPLIIENQYLFIAHEVGWLGLALFVWLYVEIMRRLWTRRRGALSLGVFASGCALAAIGLLLPVWVDDTVSIIWWGLAGIAVGGVYRGTKNGRKNN